MKQLIRLAIRMICSRSVPTNLGNSDVLIKSIIHICWKQYSTYDVVCRIHHHCWNNSAADC